MKIKVKTIYRGLVAIRENQLKECQNRKQSLIIINGHKSMTIPHKDIERSIVSKSAKTFKDKFSFEEHYLYYFKFEADDPDDELKRMAQSGIFG